MRDRGPRSTRRRPLSTRQQQTGGNSGPLDLSSLGGPRWTQMDPDGPRWTQMATEVSVPCLAVSCRVLLCLAVSCCSCCSVVLLFCCSVALVAVVLVVSYVF